MDAETDYVLYILMRTDLPSMNAGKAMAQASHASNAFIHKTVKNKSHKPASDWTQQTKQGFGTVLVLGATMDDISALHNGGRLGDITNDHFHYEWELIIDPTYPYIVNSEIKELIDGEHHTTPPHELESGDFVCFRKEITCAYLFADKNDERIQELLEGLSLHP